MRKAGKKTREASPLNKSVARLRERVTQGMTDRLRWWLLRLVCRIPRSFNSTAVSRMRQGLIGRCMTPWL